MCYIALPTTAIFASKGIKIVGVDVDPNVWNLPGGWENVFNQYFHLPCHYTLISEKVSKIKEAINEFAS